MRARMVWEEWKKIWHRARFSKTYVGMILKMLPVAVLAYGGYTALLKDAFLYGNEWFSWLYDKVYTVDWMELIYYRWAEAFFAGAILLVGILLGTGICLRMRKKEI